MHFDMWLYELSHNNERVSINCVVIVGEPLWCNSSIHKKGVKFLGALLCDSNLLSVTTKKIQCTLLTLHCLHICSIINTYIVLGLPAWLINHLINVQYMFSNKYFTSIVTLPHLFLLLLIKEWRRWLDRLSDYNKWKGRWWCWLCSSFYANFYLMSFHCILQMASWCWCSFVLFSI